MSHVPAPPPLILPLDSPQATLSVAGGKGASLSLLMRAGFPVPGGFIITTSAYDAYVVANDLRAFISRAVSGLDATYAADLEAASVAIRARFSLGLMPPELADAIRGAYLAQPVGRMSVAVRSSATAEDLPNLSFAGQQDTYLGIVGSEDLLRAVVGCWSSLWTARAIGYRARNGIPHTDVALAVVVQTMVEAEAAGVLFTANPQNGRRTEMAIDASFGTGEALVSGTIEPDQYIVCAHPSRITAKKLGAKLGGQQNIQALPDVVILELSEVGRRIEAFFGSPQDIEWAWAGNELAIVQSRPITSLYPLPEGMDPAGELRVLASVAAFQGMLDPFTPLGQDALRSVAARIGSYAGYTYDYDTVPAVRVAGERLYIDLTAVLRNGFGRKLLFGALSQIEPGIRAALRQVEDAEQLAVTSARPSPRLARHLVPLLAPLAIRFVGTLVRPDANREAAQRAIEELVLRFRERAASTHTLFDRLHLFDELVDMARRSLFGQLLPRFAPGLAALYQLYRLSDLVPQGRRLALEITRGLPHNVTTEMDLALWQTSRRILSDAHAAATFDSEDADTLARAYRGGTLPPVAQEAVAAFLRRYGVRGLAEIDLGRARWQDDPRPVMDAIRSYLRITDEEQAPDAVFGRGAEASAVALETLVAELRRLPRGWAKARRARWAARRVRALAGMRETPKFTIVRLMTALREALLQSGADLAVAGWLEQGEDVFYLHLDELRAIAAGASTSTPDLVALAAERRERYAREARRRQIPRLLLSTGEAFYDGADSGATAGTGQLFGSPVSPGVVEGAVRVVLDPRGAQLQPGEILVCPGTDPSWTPLFLAAGGLVMEVGGLMTHGSVVAREYGIPAVVGVTEVTRRLHSGQRVRVDGSTGRVTILGDADTP